MNTDFQRIVELMDAYFDMLHHSSVDALRQVFHPAALYATADESAFLHRSMDEYAAVLAARTAPASRGELRRDHIDAIELVGSNTALVRARCSIGARDFVDLLTLVRIAGRWQIIAKVFHIIEARS